VPRRRETGLRRPHARWSDGQDRGCLGDSELRGVQDGRFTCARQVPLENELRETLDRLSTHLRRSNLGM
jgi:hypothetical protein